MNRAAGGLMLVTDRRRTAPDARTTADELTALNRHLDAAIDAGIDIVQIRERDLGGLALRDLTTRLSARSGRTRVVVNDRADVAAVSHAGGVHLRAEGPPSRRVRPLLADAARVGRSVHSALEAEMDPEADWVVFGPVFVTASKPGQAAAGLAALEAVVSATPAPVFAIGGVTVDRAHACGRAGARGVAGIGLFLPAAVARHPGGFGALVRETRERLVSGAKDR
jgi:thiamine-phosphate diphosphorylase